VYRTPYARNESPSVVDAYTTSALAEVLRIVVQTTCRSSRRLIVEVVAALDYLGAYQSGLGSFGAKTRAVAPALITGESFAARTHDSDYLDLRDRPWVRSSRIQVNDVIRELEGEYHAFNHRLWNWRQDRRIDAIAGIN